MFDVFANLARRIYLSPSKEVLEDCVNFLKEAESDINLLKSIDTSKAPINYSFVEKPWNSQVFFDFGYPEVENKHLVKSLTEGYAISNIKKPS